MVIELENLFFFFTVKVMEVVATMMLTMVVVVVFTIIMMMILIIVIISWWIVVIVVTLIIVMSRVFGNVVTFAFQIVFAQKNINIYIYIYIYIKYIIFVINTSKWSKNIKKLIRSNFFQIFTKNRLKLTLKYL
jgi:hypothetical protein